MANPLARVVMNNIAQKSGMVSSKPSGVKSTGVNNLGSKEKQMLTSLLNGGKVASPRPSSIDRDSYGRSSGASKSSGKMVTLSALASNKSGNKESTVTDTKSQSFEVKTAYDTTKVNTNSGNATLNGLSALGNVTMGKSGANTNASTNLNQVNKVSKEAGRDIMKKIDLEGLLSGGSKSNKREPKKSYSYKQQSPQGNKTSLDALAKKVGGSNRKEEKTSETSNNYVRSNVMTNLEAYIPKVTLDSIGKKGSLF